MEKIVEVWREIAPKSYQLALSSLEAAQGQISFCLDGGEVTILVNSFSNSPIHNLIASPAERLLANMQSWTMMGRSNQSKLKAKSAKRRSELGILVETSFTLPADYSGHPYEERTLYFTEKHQLTKVEMVYKDGRRDVGVFSHDTENAIKIFWECQYGPNQLNFSFV